MTAESCGVCLLQGPEAAERETEERITEGMVGEIKYIRRPTTERGFVVFVVTQICIDANKINKHTKALGPTNTQKQIPPSSW